MKMISNETQSTIKLLQTEYAQLFKLNIQLRLLNCDKACYKDPLLKLHPNILILLITILQTKYD
jgi:hypothetical protein